MDDSLQSLTTNGIVNSIPNVIALNARQTGKSEMFHQALDKFYKNSFCGVHPWKFNSEWIKSAPPIIVIENLLVGKKKITRKTVSFSTHSYVENQQTLSLFETIEIRRAWELKRAINMVIQNKPFCEIDEMFDTNNSSTDKIIEPLGKYTSIQSTDDSTHIVKDGVTVYPEKQLKDNIIYQGKPFIPPAVKKAMSENTPITFESMLANSTSKYKPDESPLYPMVRDLPPRTTPLTEQEKMLKFLNSKVFHVPVKGSSEIDKVAIKAAEEKRQRRAAKAAAIAAKQKK